METMPVRPRFSGFLVGNGAELRLAVVAVAVMALVAVTLAWRGSALWYERAVDDVLADGRRAAQTKLDHMLQFVTGSFIPMGGIPQVLAVDGVFRKAAESSDGDPVRAEANTRLAYFAERLGVDVAWILDREGTCVSASNYNKEESFIGTKYTDRIYYINAKDGKPGRQFAVGRRTNIPGLFFSSPIVADGSFRGVVVIKSNLPRVADHLLQPGTFIVDSQGVVILARDDALALRTIPGAPVAKLSQQDRRRVYLTETLDPLPIASAGVDGHPEVILFGSNATPAVLSSMTVPGEGLTLFAVVEVPHISALRRDSERLFAASAVTGILLGWALTGFVVGRKRYRRKLRRAEDEVAAMRSRYELILRSAGDGIIGVGADEVVTFANPAACRMLAVECHALEGRRYREALCGGGRGICALPEFPLPAGWADARAQSFIRGDGGTFAAEYILAPMWRDGVFEGATLVFRDVSLRKRYEEHIANHQRELERQVAERTQTVLDEIRRRTLTEEAMKQAQIQAMQASKLASVGQLAAGIAHEINTPVQYVGDNLRFIGESLNSLLTAIKVAEDLLTHADAALAARFAEEVKISKLQFLRTEMEMAVRESLDGVAQIGRIVLSMKEFSHPGAHAKTMTDINRALENTLTVSRNVWKHVAEVERRYDPALPPVLCHAGEMNQVFLNLIVNAAQAIEASGKELPGRIVITTGQERGHVTISVSDNGTGVPAAIREKIFDPFFTTKEVGKGTGQGLAICYDVVVGKHDGSLDVGGREGEGAVFIVRLPMEADDDLSDDAADDSMGIPS